MKKLCVLLVVMASLLLSVYVVFAMLNGFNSMAWPEDWKAAFGTVVFVLWFFSTITIGISER